MKIGTLLHRRHRFLPAPRSAADWPVDVAATMHQTMDKVSGGAGAAGGRAGGRRDSALPQSGARLRHQHPVRARRPWTRRRGPSSVEKYRKQTDGARDTDERDPQERCPGRSRTAPRWAARHRCAEFQIRSPPRGHRQGEWSSCPAEAAQGRGEGDRRRQRRVSTAPCTALLDEQVRRMALLDGDRLPAGELRQHRLDATRRRRRLRRQRCTGTWSALERVGDRAPRRWSSAARRAGPTMILMSLQDLRGNPATPANVAAALAEDERRHYVERFGQDAEAGQGRRRQRQIRARCRRLLREIATWPGRRSSTCATPSMTMPNRCSATGLFFRTPELSDCAGRCSSRSRRGIAPRYDGPPPRLRGRSSISPRTMSHLAERRRFRRHPGRRRATTRSARWPRPCRCSRTT